MTSRDFCFWLQGFFEIGDSGATCQSLNADQITTIRRHLALVFKHEIDLAIEAEKPGSKPALDEIHHGPFPPPRMRC